MDLHTEIRKLNASDLFNLVQILECDDSWMKLMAVIPKTLTLNTFECNIAVGNLPKYNTDHIKMVDSAGMKQKRACAEILLDEWGTSGRIRPRLGHLLYLLMKTELLRAADFVSVNILKLSEVERPSSGPAAKVQIPDDQILRNYTPRENSVEYPSSLLQEQRFSSTIYNHLQTPNPPHVIPKIIITDSERFNYNNNNYRTAPKQESKKIENHVRFVDDLSNVSNDENVSNDLNRPLISDLLENNNVVEENEQIPAFSTILDRNGSVMSENIPISDNIPALSDLMPVITQNIPAFSQILETNDNIPAFSQILESNSTQTVTDNGNIPAFSEILQEQSSNMPAFSQILESKQSNFDVIKSETNIPAFSQILQSNHMPAFSQILEDSSTKSNTKSNDNIPAFNQILSEHSTASHSSSASDIPHLSDIIPHIDNLRISPVLSIGSSNSRSCVSPLPNLSLKTSLQHYSYIELEQSTNFFNEVSLNSDQSIIMENSQLSGRKLGSGAFGSVYLANGLLDKPVAVKKLNLDGVNVVNVDDTITKQFRNEVELLCKYKHDNLLSLLGYSCDGPTYCLIYEYVSGGALKDRLQKCLEGTEEKKLLWTDRLDIAMGTGKAVLYLHSAYSTPLIHRDIKTANILLDKSNKPKLCDFGLIKLTPNQNTNIGTTVFGTSAYMAPEAFRGDVSVKLDTFGFGVVLLELLTSLPPLDENREGHDLVTHMEEVIIDNDIKPLLDLNSGTWLSKSTHFGEELYEIAMLCLEEKKKRPVMSLVVNKLTELIEKLKI